MQKLPEVFGKIIGLTIVRHRNKYFRVENVHSKVTATEDGTIEEGIIECEDIKTEKKKFKFKTRDLIEAFLAQVEAEKKTGNKQILLIDMDKGEWSCNPIDEEMKKKFPFLRRLDELDYVL